MVFLDRHCGRLPFRFVEPFSISSQFQPNVAALPLNKTNVFEERNVHSTMFRTLFLRGDIPCHRSFIKTIQPGTYLIWKIPPQDLDYSYYLPMFFDGLCEPNFPYNYTARYAIHDMLSAGSEKVLPIIPQLILPIKNALNTRNKTILMATLQIIQHLLMCDPCIGQALVPYYRQMLPILNLFRNRNVHLGEGIDYDRVGRIGDIIDQTLQKMERCGGTDAYINIKYIIPTYESCVNN
ncbi:unnamed protein product [Diamesa hyperborea]